MIEFKQSVKLVEMKIDLYVPGMGTRAWTMNWNAASEEYAAFLVDALRREMSASLMAIRKKSYEDGWRDAKAKKSGKRTWFEGGWWRS